MNENAKKWVAALRSGKYEQGTGALRVDQSYCCLGVACELYREATGDGIWEGSTFFTGVPEVTPDTLPNSNWSLLLLPAPVRTWLGLGTRAGNFKLEGIAESLSGMNDTGSAFDQIADMIELEPEGLFVEPV